MGNNEDNNTTGHQMMAFDFQDNAVRCITMAGEPWFVANDVCNILGLTNSRMATQALDEDEKNTVSLTYGIRGNPNKTVINESGLYTLILRCDDAIKPGTVAHSFRKWVTSEVLPALRKTGAYSLAKAAAADARAERMAETRAYVVRGMRRVDDMVQYAMEDGVLGNRLSMNRVQKLYSLGRLRMSAECLAWLTLQWSSKRWTMMNGLSLT